MEDSKPKSLRAKALSIFRLAIWGRSTEKKAYAFAKKLNPLTYLSPQPGDCLFQYEARLVWIFATLVWLNVAILAVTVAIQMYRR